VSKRNGEVALLEKTVARKNDHIEILLRKEKDVMTVDSGKKREILEERLRKNIMQEGEGKQESKELEETVASLKAQLDGLAKKGRKQEEELKGFAKENEKLKEDNFYLVQRLKNKK
jgi:hypothetical protein